MAADDRDGTDHDVTPFARDAVGHLERQIGAARPAPDFAAMLLRARALVDADESVDAPLAPVIPLTRAVETATEDDDDDALRGAALAPFTAALRAELDAKAHERSLAGIPPLRHAAPRRRGAGLLLGLLAAAAAALFFTVGPELAREREQDRRGVEANAIESVGPRAGLTHSMPVRPREQPPAASPSGPPEPVVEPPVPEDSIEDPLPARAPAPKASPRQRRPVGDDAPAQASLEDEAQALWQRGELAAAERKLREVLAAGSERRAELAYGDLFALTRQMRGTAGQAAVWREYLARFPRGQFADDARAGLCQRAPTDERAACWRDYLVHHPGGAHRKQAQAQAPAPEVP